MRDPARIPRLIAKFVELWERTPDMRFGQMYNYVLREGPVNPGVSDDGFYTEDENWEGAIDWLLSATVKSASGAEGS